MPVPAATHGLPHAGWATAGLQVRVREAQRVCLSYHSLVIVLWMCVIILNRLCPPCISQRDGGEADNERRVQGTEPWDHPASARGALSLSRGPGSSPPARIAPDSQPNPGKRQGNRILNPN